MLTIEDERSQAELCDAIRSGDGCEVARISSELVVAGKAGLLRRACMDCASICSPSHAYAVIEYFVSSPASRKGGGAIRMTADLIATIMAGVRAGCTSPHPKESCRHAVDALLAISGFEKTVGNLVKLPARLGPSWAGIVALARTAVRLQSPQEPLVHNARLLSLFENRSDRGTERADANLKLGALWSYSRDPAPASVHEATDMRKPSSVPAPRVIACDAPSHTGEQIKCILSSS